MNKPEAVFLNTAVDQLVASIRQRFVLALANNDNAEEEDGENHEVGAENGENPNHDFRGDPSPFVVDTPINGETFFVQVDGVDDHESDVECSWVQGQTNVQKVVIEDSARGEGGTLGEALRCETAEEEDEKENRDATDNRGNIQTKVPVTSREHAFSFLFPNCLMIVRNRSFRREEEITVF